MPRLQRVIESPEKTRGKRSTVADIVTEAAFRAIAEAFAAQGLLRRGFQVLGCSQCGATFIGTSRTAYCSESCKTTGWKHARTASRRRTADREVDAQEARQGRAEPRQRPEAPQEPLPPPAAPRRPAATTAGECGPACPGRARYRTAGSDDHHTEVFCALHDPAPAAFEPVPPTE